MRINLGVSARRKIGSLKIKRDKGDFKGKSKNFKRTLKKAIQIVEEGKANFLSEMHYKINCSF